jgi:hypothetical protein
MEQTQHCGTFAWLSRSKRFISQLNLPSAEIFIVNVLFSFKGTISLE